MNSSTETPIYRQLVSESDWTPDQLRPPFQIDALIAESYMALLRRQLRAMVLRRVATARKRRKVRGQLP
jgi:hypothetical protein